MTKKITIRTNISPANNGKSVRIRTSVNNGRSTKTTTKTIRVK